MLSKHLAALALLTASTVTAHAEAPVAYPITLGDLHGVAYYTVEPEGLQVVATIMEGEDGTPMRNSMLLRPGQTMRLSTPGTLGQPATELELRAGANRLEIIPHPALIN
ncbi:hypothetical protein [Paracoccus rhizosphaerae]|uniref:Copper binding protein CusF n=1 Tax=Paracoccus rhizosphaerae TaxID=1133347 RepID=A0ABV6CI48_9RHOB|nr:hypothetical protein [Paracoccus rhizosphaerae]